MVERMERPEPTVLPDSALVPEGSLVRPTPTQFTHELTREQPFHYIGSSGSSHPDGNLAAGTMVVVLNDDGDVADVVDGRGLHVSTSRDGLRQLS